MEQLKHCEIYFLNVNKANIYINIHTQYIHRMNVEQLKHCEIYFLKVNKAKHFFFSKRQEISTRSH